MPPTLAFLCGACAVHGTGFHPRNSSFYATKRPFTSIRTAPVTSPRVAMLDGSRPSVQSGLLDGGDETDVRQNPSSKQKGSARRETSFVDPDADLTELLTQDGADVECGDFRPDVPLLNSVLLTGRLGQDPILRHLGSDASRKLALLTFSLAVQDEILEGEWEPGKSRTTSWFNCEVWGQKAESASRFLRKGLRVGVTGQLGFSVYTNREGVEVEAPAITVASFEVLQSRSEADQGASASPSGRWRGGDRSNYGGGAAAGGYDGAVASDSASRYPSAASQSDGSGSRASGQVPSHSQPRPGGRPADEAVGDDLPF